jgi:hypothetical protein
MEGTMMAHVDGGVPNIQLSIPKVDEYNLGQLIYFFEISCALSGYVLDVNPFDQPGVEAYKRNMFQVVGKARGLISYSIKISVFYVGGDIDNGVMSIINTKVGVPHQISLYN